VRVPPGHVTHAQEQGGENHHQVEQLESAARGVLGQQGQAGQQQHRGDARAAPADPAAREIGQRHQHEGKHRVQGEDVLRPIAREVMQHRYQEGLEQRTLVELAGQELERPLDVVAPHRHERSLSRCMLIDVPSSMISSIRILNP